MGQRQSTIKLTKEQLKVKRAERLMEKFPSHILMALIDLSNRYYWDDDGFKHCLSEIGIKYLSEKRTGDYVTHWKVDEYLVRFSLEEYEIVFGYEFIFDRFKSGLRPFFAAAFTIYLDGEMIRGPHGNQVW